MGAATVLARQQEIGSLIEKMSDNFKKDSASRKTADYIEKRISSLNALWTEFSLNHKKLLKLEENHDDEAYFVDDYFGLVEKIKQQLMLGLTEVSGPSQREDETGSIHVPATMPDRISDSLGRLQRKQSSLQLVVKHFLQSIARDTVQPQTHQYYRLKINRLLAYEDELKQNQDQLWEQSNNGSPLDTDAFFELQYSLQDAIITLQEFMESLNSQTSVKYQQTPNARVNLPKITLPVFIGDYLQWNHFHDLYVQLIHSQPLSNAEKMFYLTSNLGGEAKALIKHLSPTNENYDTAWDIIVSRYNNTRLIVTSILNKLLTQPSITSDSAAPIKLMHDITNECLLGLENLNIGVNHWDPIFLHILLRKLDRSSLTLYEQGLHNPKELGTVRHFMEFLESRFLTLEAVQRGSSRKIDQYSSAKTKSFSATVPRPCPCGPQEYHQLYKCNTFLSWQPEKRAQFLMKDSRCINCMKSGHFANQCTSRRCLRCNKRHNTLIHASESTVNPSLPTSFSSNDKTAALSIHSEQPKSGFVLLGTVEVRIMTGAGNEIVCKALLDSGSQINVISERLAKKLGVNYKRSNMTIEGIGKSISCATHRVNVLLKAINTSFSLRMEAFILPKITGDQPVKYVNTQSWPIPANIKLADPHFNHPSRIDLLIGAEYYYQLLQPEQHTMGPDMPLLQNSSLGWIVAGRIADLSTGTLSSCNIGAHGDESPDISQQIERFWRLEENYVKNPFTAAEDKCEREFKQNTQRDPSGRFIVRLPFIRQPTDLGESKHIALNRFLALERRLAGNTDVNKLYFEFMEEYIRLGHMIPVQLSQLDHPYYFLPHHFVWKPDSTTTKLRVVFDASAQTSNNLSLNNILAKGPVLQNELFSILLRFRMHRYVMTADVKQMFRQVMVHEDDQRYQLIFWRNNPQEELKCYKLTTVTYGTTSAPYLATKCLQTLAEQRSRQYPSGSSILQSDVYVDDVMTGSDNLSEAVHMQSELISLVQEGGFHLRKWCSNHPRLLERFQPQDMEVNLDFTSDTDDHIKTLGLRWCPKKDLFSVHSLCPVRNKITKRSAYSDIAHIFDPMGILSPIVVTGKILVQEMWKLKSDWDEELPLPLRTEWIKFKAGLQDLKDLTFPRHVFDHHFPKEIQLHAFADASKKAYGAAIYVRAITRENLLIVRLLCAKSRVAPNPEETIPKLELCAAKLAAELCYRVKSDIKSNVIQDFYWTDSANVIAWLNQPCSSNQTFVANRVAAIQRLTSADQWRHVSSKDNPADIVSRGASPEKLKKLSTWFYGPLFLHAPKSAWPSDSVRVSALPITLSDKLLEMIRNVEHRNSFRRLQRIVAYVLRFSERIKGNHNHHEHLTAEELNDAMYVLVKCMQQDEFSGDITYLDQYGELPKNSTLQGLAPFIDERNIVRVGGRLQEANIAYNSKHPMLLPYSHPLTKLLMTDLHINNKHAPPQTLLSITRQKFWPIKGKVIARSIVHHCIHCARSTPKLLGQIMGNLPAKRVQPARPFINTGVDYCGPFWTHFKIRGKRPLKSYVAIFCCFATKALHLELVTDLTTNAFIGALKRFISRRGHCLNIYSDNATNFVGAKNQLQEIYDAIYTDHAKDQITSVCGSKGITFHFIPPRAPHFGGLWEAAVKSTKRLMQRQISSASLTYEELETLIIEIEAILNSRPITPMSSDPNDLTALTPGHFLIGEPLTSNVDPEAKGLTIKLDTRWQLVRQIKNEFWDKWTTEYLHGLQERVKWKDSHSNIQPGTLVMIKEDNTPPLQWPLGRIVTTIKGKDDRVRVAKIKTASQIIERPIHKVAPLPVENIENDNTKLFECHGPGKRTRLQSSNARSCNDTANHPPKHRRTLDPAP